MKASMKLPLIIAAVIVVVRVILEQLGMPAAVNNIFGVAWLYFLVPVYFAVQISNAGDETPYKSLLKNTAFYTFYTRLMVLPTYSLAYMLQWQQPRFGINGGGVVGGDLSPLNGYLLYPVRNLFVWIIFATIIGMIIGGITLAIRRRAVAKAAS